MPNFTKITNNIRELTIKSPAKKNSDLVWLNISDARKDELKYLRKHFPFSLTHLEASSTKAKAQRPIVEKGDNYLFMILHFPVIENDDIVSGEIEFFISKGSIVTLHDNIASLNSFFNYFKKTDKDTLSAKDPSAALLLYEILKHLMSESFTLLDTIGKKIDEMEHLIFDKESKKAVFQILSLRRDILNTSKILQNHKNIIKRLLSKEIGLVKKESHEQYYLSLLEKSKRIWENLLNKKDMIEILNSTNESFLNYHISDIMKTLTIFSVIVFPLTLLAAIFGMNVEGGMPFIISPNGFWIIIAIMLVGCLSMVLYFEKKKWL